MRLYSGLSRNFIDDTVRNQIAGKLENAFFHHFRYKPSPGEVNSWRNSLRAVAQVFQTSDLLDHGVILEYQLPLTSKRLDCTRASHPLAAATRSIRPEAARRHRLRFRRIAASSCERDLPSADQRVGDPGRPGATRQSACSTVDRVIQLIVGHELAPTVRLTPFSYGGSFVGGLRDVGLRRFQQCLEYRIPQAAQVLQETLRCFNLGLGQLVYQAMQLRFAHGRPAVACPDDSARSASSGTSTAAKNSAGYR